MSSISRFLPLMAIWAVGFAAAGCYVTQGSPDEVCNYQDDDWTGVVDDPFVDASGRYVTDAHCGTCGTSCDEVFPTASGTSCFVPDGAGSPYCIITACPEGHHVLEDVMACIPDFSVQCLPCEDDHDCMLGDPDASCVEIGDGDTRCAPSCEADPDSCEDGFGCLLGRCLPSSGSCECTPPQAGSTFGCWLESPVEELLCPGEQVCEGYSVGECLPQLEDICDGADNNCDGQVDEDFIQDGHYVDDDHCGACNNPCVPPASNMSTQCSLEGSEPTCLFECLSGFVDVDGVALNGCECEMMTVAWPPAALGGDGNCDGVQDDLSGYIFVSKDGHDSNPGTIEEPVLTISQGIVLATPTHKTVFVSQGVFNEEVNLAAGVSMFGGYRSDFKERDQVVYATIIHHTSGPPGHPAVRAADILTETEIAGFTVKGTDAVSPGAGSTAMLMDNCSSDLEIWDMTVWAGKGASGISGASSSQILNGLGITSLSQLDGANGTSGGNGINSWTYNCFGLTVAGGGGGNKVCPVTSILVSGGGGGNSSCPNTGCVIGLPCGNAGCSDYTVGGVCDFDAVYADAVPNPSAEDGHGPGAGAGGDLTYDAPTTIAGVTFCDDNPTLRREGGPGGDGQDGVDGLGGSGFTDPAGYFSEITGIWTSGDGTDASGGTDGSGGGGGTQGNGYDRISGASSTYQDRLGGAGGGGGSGGCSSPGATAGTGGGSSIGVVVFLTLSNDGPYFHDARVAPAKAGDGGDGGVGASGGMPGAGGLGGEGNFWCARRGGKGGDGGRGGSGGGGGGGGGGSISGFHIIPGPWGTATGYSMSLATDNTVDALPAPGTGGSGGYSPGNPGSSGVAGTSVAFRIYDPD